MYGESPWLINAFAGEHGGGHDHDDECNGHDDPPDTVNLEVFAQHDITQGECDDGLCDGHGGQ